MSGGLRLLEQPIASASRVASYAGETIAMQRAGSQLIDMWPDWSQYQAMVTISGVGDGAVTRYDMAAPWWLSSWTFLNAYRANVGHIRGLVVYKLLKLLARPRRIEPLFSP
jgi:hypothetical protein